MRSSDRRDRGLIASLAMEVGQVPEQAQHDVAATCRRMFLSSRADSSSMSCFQTATEAAGSRSWTRYWRSHAAAARVLAPSSRSTTSGSIVRLRRFDSSSGRMIASAAVRETSGERSKRAMRHRAGDAFAAGKLGQVLDAPQPRGVGLPDRNRASSRGRRASRRSAPSGRRFAAADSSRWRRLQGRRRRWPRASRSNASAPIWRSSVAAARRAV